MTTSTSISTATATSTEAERLQSLERYRLLDSDSEKALDDITLLAAEICETPMAMITFVGADRVWFRSKVGVKMTETSRDDWFCTHAIQQADLLIVPDAFRDERFKDHPLVRNDPPIRFYAGAQLLDPSDHVLGTICVLDRQPRTLRASQQHALRVLARLVSNQLDLRRQMEEMRRLELEAENLRLVRRMANRLVHEIGNAMVPLSTHHQLLPERSGDSEFLTSLDAALTESTRRVTRLISQMRHLAQEVEPGLRSISLQNLVEGAFQLIAKHQEMRQAQLSFRADNEELAIHGDVDALSHAFGEIILNALQANPPDPTVEVGWSVKRGAEGSTDWVLIDFLDHGLGFPPLALENATQLFFTTRDVGPGLGLAVSRSIIEKHGGHIEIPVPGHTGGGVRVFLPLVSNGYEPQVSPVAADELE